jgi:hypothetical protein
MIYRKFPKTASLPVTCHPALMVLWAFTIFRLITSSNFIGSIPRSAKAGNLYCLG